MPRAPALTHSVQGLFSFGRDKQDSFGRIGVLKPHYPKEEPCAIHRTTPRRSLCRDPRSSSGTKSNVTDVANFVLTEAELYLPWAWDGSNVTDLGGGYTDARWLTDGWLVTDGPYWYLYDGPLPSWQRDGEGWADFAYIGESYAHEHRAIQHVDGGGGCYADFQFSGEICASCSVDYFVWTE